ncbi:MAG: TonB-dependent receptor plug domain-containing protein, partial [Gammaproteobacteria bacterium]
MKYQTFVVIVCASLAHSVSAAEAVQLPTIAVTAEPWVESAPLQATAVAPEVLKARRAATSDSARLFSDVPGVSIYGAGGVAGLPSIHGLADDRLRIKVDGMDLISACGNHMNPPLSYIDPSSVASATVFAGITPVSVGGDSIGGTILLTTAPPVFAEAGAGVLRQGEVGAFYRSNGNARGGNLTATVATQNLSLTYRGATAQADNYTAGGDFKSAGLAAAGREWLAADEVGSTYYQSSNQALALALRQEHHLLELTLGEQDIPAQGWPNQRMDMTANDSRQTNLRYQGDYDWGTLEARAFHEHTRHKMQFGEDKLYWYGANNGSIPDGEPCTPSPGMNGCAAGMPMDTEGKNSGAVLQAEIPVAARELLRVGSEIQQYRLNDWWAPSGKGMWPNTFWSIRDGERDRLALFAEWEAQWNRQWLTQLGVRGEQVKMNTGEVQGYNTTSAQYLAESTAF